MEFVQQSVDKLDLSSTLHAILAARSLTVGQLAEIAGVSKSAIEKYLAGPSSPRAVTVANLSKGLGLSADTVLFGQIDPHVEIAYEVAFRAFADLIKDLKACDSLGQQFTALDANSSAFADFVRNLAFERAGQFKRAYNAARRDEHFSFCDR